MPHALTIVAKEHKIQDLLRSHDRAITAKEWEIQQLIRRQLEQAMFKEEPTEVILEGELKQTQLELPLKDQGTQLQTRGDSKKYMLM